LAAVCVLGRDSGIVGGFRGDTLAAVCILGRDTGKVGGIRGDALAAVCILGWESGIVGWWEMWGEAGGETLAIIFGVGWRDSVKARRRPTPYPYPYANRADPIVKPCFELTAPQP
jgi:hypothetical protein